MAQTTKRKQKKKKKRSNGRNSAVIAVIILLLLLAVTVFFLLRLLHRFPQPEVTLPSEETSVAAPEPPLPESPLISACFGEENGYKTYTDGTITASLGMDISSHQGWIDWYAVAESDVDYVILRAGYRGYGDGSINLDEYFQYNITTANDVGLGVGIYFFSQAITEEEAEAEAHTVLSMISGYNVDYPIYFDWEPVADPTARTANISATELTACAKRFCDTIIEAGYSAGVYFNPSIAANLYQLSELRDYELWLAEYANLPTFPYEVGMWQYCSDGQVPGVDAIVDLNLCFRSYGN